MRTFTTIHVRFCFTTQWSSMSARCPLDVRSMSARMLPPPHLPAFVLFQLLSTTINHSNYHPSIIITITTNTTTNTTMPAVNRVPAVSGADAVEPPPAYQSIAFSVAPGNRPLLPEDKRNNYLSYAPTHSDPDALVVKFQTIVREEREIVVGRLKIPTVSKSLDEGEAAGGNERAVAYTCFAFDR